MVTAGTGSQLILGDTKTPSTLLLPSVMERVPVAVTFFTDKEIVTGHAGNERTNGLIDSKFGIPAAPVEMFI